MAAAPPAETTEEGSAAPWYVYDRHHNLLRISSNLAEAEAWAIEHWDVVEIAGREQVDAHDYWYLLFAAPEEAGYSSRDYQARIVRQDRVVAIGRDPDAIARFPQH